MPLDYKGTIYNSKNTKKINYLSNDVKLLAYAKYNNLISGKTGNFPMTDNLGMTTYYVNLTLVMDANLYDITVEELTLGLTYDIISYNKNTGEIKLTIVSTKPNQEFTFKLIGRVYLWAKPFNFEVSYVDGIDVEIYRKSTLEPLSEIRYLDLQDEVYYGDEIEITVFNYDDLDLKPYPTELIITDNTYINIQEYQSKSISVNAKSGTILVNIDGLQYYKASGNINIGLNAKNISIVNGQYAMKSEFNYNENTGNLTYTIYSSRQNTTVYATIKYKI